MVVHGKKRPVFEAFCCPWIYIPETGQMAVAGLPGAFTGISAFGKAENGFRRTPS